MNCPNCQNPLKPTQKFCPVCGTKIEQSMPEYGSTGEPMTQAADAPMLDYTSTGEPVTMAADDQAQNFGNPEAFGAENPPTQPENKKKSKLPLIIIIAVAAALLIAGGVFAAIHFFGNKDKGKTEDTTAPATTVSAPAASADSAPAASSDPNAVIKRFEQAINNNDRAAMEQLFIPEMRTTGAKSAFTLVSTLNSFAQQAGSKLVYTCDLQNLQYDDAQANATGNVIISIEIPVVGKQSTTSTVSFTKVDNEWYISKIA